MTDDIHALIGAYAIDAVTDQERADFEEHLAVCGHCRDELAGMREAAALLGGSDPATPPESLRGSVLAGIKAVRPLPPVVPGQADDTSHREQPSGAEPAAEGHSGHSDSPAPVSISSRRTRRWLIAAVAAAVIVVGGITWHPWTHTSPPASVTAVSKVLHAPDAHRLVKHLEGGSATVVYSRKLGRSVLETHGVAPAPAGHTYQLWYMTADGTATGAGFITPTGTGHATVLLKGDADKAALLGITVEPAGGSPQPTTKPILAVRLTS